MSFFLSKKTVFKIMKISLAQFVITLFISGLGYAGPSHGQNLLNKKISLSIKDSNLKGVIKDIEKEADVFFSFKREVLSSKEKISLDIKNQTVESILTHILSPRQINFQVVSHKQIILTKPVEGTTVISPANSDPGQARLADQRVTGIVRELNGDVLTGVSVVVKGSNQGTTTDSEGKYIIDIPEGKTTLTFSFVGYVSRDEVIDKRSLIDIELAVDSKSLQELVVVGYGTVKKSDLTGSVSSVSSEKLTQVKAVSNIAQALQGQAAGVQVNQRSGQPGESMSIKIRGTNSIAGGNSPLYVVDGLPLDGLSAQLNPDDIEQIEILKDASSTAIYGSRGSNGVIMITTKKGKEGKVNVTYNGYYGVQNLRKKIDLINASEFAQLQNEVATNDGKELPWTASQISALGQGTDWQDLVYRSAKVQNHDLAISGGSATTKYYTSFGFFDQNGIIENSGFKRFSFRANLDQQISKKLSFSTNMSLQNSVYNQAVYTSADGGGGIPFTTMTIPATQGVYDAEGKYTRFTGVSWGETNPIGISKELRNPSTSIRLIGNTALTYQILDALKLRVSAGIDGNYGRSNNYAPSNISIGQPGGRASRSYGNGSSFVNENLLMYTKEFNKHFLDVIAGMTYQSDKSQGLSSGTAVGFISDVYQDNNLGSATTKAQPSTSYTDFQLISYLGRITYNFDSRYFATITGRYDGSSKFGENNKFAFFPSAAVAWRVSQEKFMQDLTSVSNLKLRASLGISGNQAIDPYTTLARLSNTNVIFNNQNYTGFVQGSLSNKGLKWETTRQLDLGIDLGLWRDRVQLTADYYKKKTTDLLLNVTLPSSTGFGSVLQNVGAVQNEGYELDLTTNNITGAFKWTSVLTWSANRTKVLDLGNDATGNPITYKEVGAGGNWFPMIVGQSLSQLYGYKVLGIYQTNEEAIQNGEPSKKAGDYKFWDMDGNGVINGDDRSTLTQLAPKFTFGFNNNFSYKNFDLSILLVGSYGNDIVNEFRKYNISLNGNWMPTKEAFDQRWKGEGTGNTIDKPSANSGSSIRDYANDKWVENGSYLRLRDITLGYRFPNSILKPIGVKSIYVYISAQNYLTWTKYSGYDPEASWNSAVINGWDRGVYPSTKSLTGGIKVNF
jgi:TonB-linked SusC/RagA family outer membrane protein